ncbi:MAG: hypothetical protein ABR515_06550 [Nitrososphaeraceae archaeon]
MANIEFILSKLCPEIPSVIFILDDSFFFIPILILSRLEASLESSPVDKPYSRRDASAILATTSALVIEISFGKMELYLLTKLEFLAMLLLVDESYPNKTSALSECIDPTDLFV